MHDFAVFNRKILPADKIFLSVISSAALYGKGIFTTVAVYDSKPFLWEKHWRRLTANAEKIGIDLSDFSEIFIKESLAEIIAANNLADGRARVTFFDESASRIWSGKPSEATGFSIQTGDFRRAPENFSLTVSPFAVNSKSPLANVKSCNYLENVLAFDDAGKRGFNEAVRPNERGEIVSATMASVFWTKNDEIFTSALETGCLAGTTRELVCEKFAVAAVSAPLTNLFEADEIFLASAGIGIVQVAEFQGKNLAREPHKLARFLSIKTNVG